MNDSYLPLYLELECLKKDLEDHLKNKELSDHVKKLAEEELKDVIETIERWKKGCFGICSETGQILPKEILSFQPAVTAVSQMQTMLKYLKKPVYS